MNLYAKTILKIIIIKTIYVSPAIMMMGRGRLRMRL